MIAVGVPAYKTGIENGTRTFVDLLGVASTDVPVEDIDKLTLPYKVFKHIQTSQLTTKLMNFLIIQLGVNAYPFIVSNNGFVLLHPDLRPTV